MNHVTKDVVAKDIQRTETSRYWPRCLRVFGQSQTSKYPSKDTQLPGIGQGQEVQPEEAI